MKQKLKENEERNNVLHKEKESLEQELKFHAEKLQMLESSKQDAKLPQHEIRQLLREMIKEKKRAD